MRGPRHRGRPSLLSLSLTRPPHPGNTLTAAASWYANSTAGPAGAVSGGTGNVKAELDGISVYTSPPVNACGPSTVSLPLGLGTLLITGLPCSAAAPLAANTAASVSISLTLGKGVPHGDFAVILDMKDQAAKPLYCMNATFKM